MTGFDAAIAFDADVSFDGAEDATGAVIRRPSLPRKEKHLPPSPGHDLAILLADEI